MTTLCRNVRKLHRPWRVLPGGGCWGKSRTVLCTLLTLLLAVLEQMLQTPQFSQSEEDSGIFLTLSWSWSGSWSSR